MSANPTWDFLSSQALLPESAALDSPIECAFFRCFHYFTSGRVANGRRMSEVLTIEPQVRLGRYRADFVVLFNGDRRVVVECDGRAFHDLTPEQSAKDKARDRKILREYGLPVMRFTGSQLYASPFECVSEAALFAMGPDQAP